MTNLKEIIGNLIGTYTPNTNTTGFFAGVDAEYIMCAIVLAVIFAGLFGLIRVMFRR